MRSVNSAKNLLAGVTITIISTLLGFLTRRIFVDNIGVEYLGLNGLLQNILGAMSLLEGGFATSVVYNLYKPLADNDRPKILALLQLYRKVYHYIAIGLFILSFILFFFLDYFIKDIESLSYVGLVYFIFVFNSLVQYFTAYKWSLVNADQQQHKLVVINLAYQLGLSLTKICILYYTSNYILYLLFESFFLIGLNVAVVHKVNKLYPFIKSKIKYKIDSETQRNIITNMKALFLSSVGGYLSYSVDNIVLSSFVGISIVGIYSNYTMLINTINSFINQFVNSVSESVGNLIASESKEKVYDVFNVLHTMNFLIVSLITAVLYNVLNLFISWWLGKDLLLDTVTVSIILAYFYMNGMRFIVMTFKFKSGIFVKDRFSPLIQGVINLVLSIILVQYLGIGGVLLGTIISVLCLGFWQVPYLLYKYKFELTFSNYISVYIKYMVITAIIVIVSHQLCSLVTVSHLLCQVIVNSCITILSSSVIYALFLYKDPNIKKLVGYGKMLTSMLPVHKSKAVGSNL